MPGSPRAWCLLLAALAWAGCVEPGEPRTTTRAPAAQAAAPAPALITDARAGVSFRAPEGLDLEVEHFEAGPPGQMRHRLVLTSQGTERLAVELWHDVRALPVGQWFQAHLAFVRDGLEQVSWRNVSAHQVRGMMVRRPRSPQALGQRMAIFAHPYPCCANGGNCTWWAWERRYGVPSPTRTDTAYRLYTDEDIARVRRMRDLIDQGLPARLAAREVLAEQEAAAAPRPEGADAGQPLADIPGRIIETLTRGDLAALDRELAAALLTGSAADVARRVFRPLMQQVGDLWAAGELTVDQEHLLSERIMGHARDLLRLLQQGRGGPRVLAACFASEHHALPLYLAALEMSAWGLEVVVLGARTPPVALGHAVARLEPNLVALSVTRKPRRDRVAALLDGYAEACGDVPWVVGGAAVAALAQEIEARGGQAAEEMDSARGLIMTLIGRR